MVDYRVGLDSGLLERQCLQGHTSRRDQRDHGCHRDGAGNTLEPAHSQAPSSVAARSCWAARADDPPKRATRRHATQRGRHSSASLTLDRHPTAPGATNWKRCASCPTPRSTSPRRSPRPRPERNPLSWCQAWCWAAVRGLQARTTTDRVMSATCPTRATQLLPPPQETPLSGPRRTLRVISPLREAWQSGRMRRF
jgi:hypothetical protein